ncbi:MAG: TIGR03619 family F420-dependent LLM class oxidoreductase [Actinomycetota bacterium]|nr:MAG: TIGR03619 family F420-dependent LLM class oxidoreductase [Actinomycetota bacterium]
MVAMGVLLSDVPLTVPAAQQFQDLVRIARAADRNGFSYIAVGQHFVEGDSRWLQPIPLLARLAAEVGPSVRLLTHIAIAPLYPPVLLAEELATLDIVTDGRLIFGAGLGYRPDEFASLGVPFAERAARFDDILEVLPLLWTRDVVDFTGRHLRLQHVRTHLRPVQQPHVPIWVGGTSDAAIQRAARCADAWVAPQETTPELAIDRWKVLRAGLEARGKQFGPQPFRRNVVIADSQEQANAEYRRVAEATYANYASRGADPLGGRPSGEEFIRSVQSHAVLGTADTVVPRLVALVEQLPIDPLIVRPQWPGMSADETIEVIDRLGQDLVPAIRAVPAHTRL